jgi:DNA-binding transcriptional LysR family regulator
MAASYATSARGRAWEALRGRREQEGVAQPSLSQQILKLESEMGGLLFERLGRSVPLTPCGELRLPQAPAILRQFADARHSVQGLLSGVKGRLTVGSIPTGHTLSRCKTLVPD